MVDATSLSKTIYIRVDKETIDKDIQLLLTFEQLPSGDFEKVAWKVSNVNYSPDVDQTIPVFFESTLGFSIASKQEDRYIVSEKIIAMDLQETVDIVMDSDQLTFDNKIKKDERLSSNQISTWNNAKQKVGVSVGFMDGHTLNPAGYIPELTNKTVWIATYTPDLTLYVASDAKTGQVISTIAKTDPIYTWPLASSKVPDKSRWLLFMNDDSEYQIKKDE